MDVRDDLSGNVGVLKGYILSAGILSAFVAIFLLVTVQDLVWVQVIGGLLAVGAAICFYVVYLADRLANF